MKNRFTKVLAAAGVACSLGLAVPAVASAASTHWTVTNGATRPTIPSPAFCGAWSNAVVITSNQQALEEQEMNPGGQVEWEQAVIGGCSIMYEVYTPPPAPL